MSLQHDSRLQRLEANLPVQAQEAAPAMGAQATQAVPTMLELVPTGVLLYHDGSAAAQASAWPAPDQHSCPVQVGTSGQACSSW